VESLAIYPIEPTCDPTDNHPYKNCQSKMQKKVNKSENHYNPSSKSVELLNNKDKHVTIDKA
jgi:hypothetical protein